MSFEIPAINANVGSSMSAPGPGFYNSLSYWLEDQVSKKRRRWETFTPRLNKVQWKANKGYQMRAVGVEDSPEQRQDFKPALLKDNNPKMDVVLGRERVSSADLYEHIFMSSPFSFVPDLFDYLQHVMRHREIIERKMVRATELFYRTRIFAHAPYVYLAGTGLIATPTGFESDGTPQKYATIAGEIDKVKSSLNYNDLFKAIMEWSDAVNPEPRTDMAGPNSAIDGHFDLILGTSDWAQLGNDAFVKANRRPEADDLLFAPLKGSPFGSLKPVFEHLQMRFNITASALDFPQPEKTIVSSGDSTEGMTVVSDEYAAAKYRVIYLFGAPPGLAVSPGAPPSAFRSSNVPKDFAMMDWNGRPKIAPETIMQAQDQDGNTVTMSNYFGRMLRWIANGVYGYRPDFPRNVLPIIIQAPNYAKTV